MLLVRVFAILTGGGAGKVGAGRTDLAQWDAASLIKTECTDDLTGMKAYETAPKVHHSISGLSCHRPFGPYFTVANGF
jgi:hypothetical protein